MIVLPIILYSLFFTGQFQLLNPQNQVVKHVGDSVVYTCSVASGTATNITWTQNGAQFADNNVMQIFNPNIAGGIGQLTISNLTLSYSESEVRCLVHFDSGNPAPSNPSTLFVLGK